MVRGRVRLEPQGGVDRLLIARMPELHNIQAYLSLHKRRPENALEMFRSLLGNGGLLTQEVNEWFECLRWSPADDGLVYPSAQRWVTANVEGRLLEVAPHALGWTPRIIPSLKADWLEVGLLLKTEDISVSAPDDWRYRSDLERVLYHLVIGFLPISVDAPTFLTDEVQDGKPWESWIGDGDEPWAFDLAVVSDLVTWPAKVLPVGFSQTSVNGGMAIARDAIWPVLPWNA